MRRDAARDGPGIGKLADAPGAGKRGGGERHHRHRADDDDRDADPQVDPAIGHEVRTDALVDQVALLEKQLPGRHGGADDRDDEQHHVRQMAARRQSGDDEIVDEPACRRVD
ncbi:hypothetical protein LTR94_034101, partial [Friedmanniomyces endolithicus]